LFHRFSIGLDGKLTVAVGPRQAIAVHTGALGSGLPTLKATQVSVLFSETATTVLGEVSFPSIDFGFELPSAALNYVVEYLRRGQPAATW
jgi:hypothetical protein